VRTRKKIQRAAEVVVVEFLLRTARAMPRRLGQAIFARVGALAARTFGKDRQRAIANLGVAFPQAPGAFRRAMAVAMFKTLGRNTYEFIRMEGASQETLLDRVERIEGMENFLAAHRRGKGVIGITGHIGCWEIMPAHFVARGYPVSVIARRMKVARLNDRLVGIRKSVGVDTIDRDENPRRMFEPLRRGEILGVLIDQHTSVGGMWVPFFGRPAFTPTAAAKIALASGAAIVPMGVFLGRDGRHTVHVLPEIPVRDHERAAREQVVREITEACSLAVEKLIRIDPKQWVWFHHRWREPDTKDDGAEAAYAAEG
jgi:KDO2-lipid IV(A) lauroyltransferase